MTGGIVAHQSELLDEHGNKILQLKVWVHLKKQTKTSIGSYKELNSRAPPSVSALKLPSPFTCDGSRKPLRQQTVK